MALRRVAVGRSRRPRGGLGGIADDKAAPTPKDAQAAKSPAPPENFREITYEVRWLDFAASPWRDRVEGQLTACGQDPTGRGWIIDEEGASILMKHLLSDATSNMLQVPKVTAVENDLATIIVRSDGVGIGGRGKVDLQPDEEFRRKYKLGRIYSARSRVDMSGSFSPRGVRISVDLEGPSGAVARGKSTDGPKAEATPNRPDAVAFQWVGTCEIPTGSSLLIGMGRYENRGGAKTESRERLIVITPRRFVAAPTNPR